MELAIINKKKVMLSAFPGPTNLNVYDKLLHFEGICKTCNLAKTFCNMCIYNMEVQLT